MNEEGVVEEKASRGLNENLAQLTRVPVEVTVELGRSDRTIGEILELGSGSLIELESIVGEPVDLLVNGHFFAKGEVGGCDFLPARPHRGGRVLDLNRSGLS